MFEHGFLVVESKPSARLDREFLEIAIRRDSPGRLDHGVQHTAVPAARDEMADELRKWHLRELAQMLTVRRDHRTDAIFAPSLRLAAVPAGEHHAGGEALQVPLPRAGRGLVKIVEVEHQSAVGRRIGAEVMDMRIAAQLDR